MHPTIALYLKPFMGKALSVAEAAEKLNVSMNLLYYRVKRFEKADILEKVAVKKRQGRAVSYYQASADSFFIPFEASSSESLEQLLNAHNNHWQPNLMKGIAAAYATSGLADKEWGVRIDMMQELMTFGINPLPELNAPELSPKGMINFWDTRHYLSDEDVESLKLELNTVLNKYLKKNSGPRKVLRLALADWSED